MCEIGLDEWLCGRAVGLLLDYLEKAMVAVLAIFFLLLALLALGVLPVDATPFMVAVGPVLRKPVGFSFKS